MAVFLWFGLASNPWVPVIGYAAGTLTTLSFLPQVIKVYRSKHAQDLSVGMFSAFCLGVFLWLVYGIALWSWPIIVPNVVTLILAGTVLLLKLHYDARDSRKKGTGVEAKTAEAAVAEPGQP